MAKYTTQVRTICENSAGFRVEQGLGKIDEVLQKSAPVVFNFNFPIFDEEYRLPLEIKILKHYYMREIGEETVGLWKLRLNTKLNEIMPYYNQLYESELIKFNPLYDTDLTTEGNNNSNKNQKENSSKTNKDEYTENTIGKDTTTSSKNGKTISESDTSYSTSGNTTGTTTNEHNDTEYELYSDTPQGALTGVDTEQYLTNATKRSKTGGSTDNVNNTTTESGSGSEDLTVTSNESGNSTTDKTGGKTSGRNITETNTHTNDITNTDEYIKTVVGKSGGESYSKRLKEFRETFLNIDLMIIEELQNLFFKLWD